MVLSTLLLFVAPYAWPFVFQSAPVISNKDKHVINTRATITRGTLSLCF